VAKRENDLYIVSALSCSSEYSAYSKSSSLAS